MILAKKAITFIELIFVTVIIGILIAVSFPQFKRTASNLELQNFAKDIYYLARLLQSSAVSQARIYYLNIDQEEKKFWTTYKDGQDFKKAEGRFAKTITAPEGIVVSLGDPDQNGVFFYPDGSSQDIKISFNNKYNTIIWLEIKGTTGAIKIQ